MQFLDLQGAALLSLVQAAIVLASLAISALFRRRGERALNHLRSTPSRHRLVTRDVPIVLFVWASLGIMLVAPIAILVVRSLQSRSGALTFSHYVALFSPPSGLNTGTSIGEAVWLSVRLALLATLLAMVLGVFIAFVISARPRTRIARLAQAGFDVIAMMPIGLSAVTLGFGLLLTMYRPLGIGIDLRTSIVLIPIAQALVALPLVVRSLAPVLRGIDPGVRGAAAVLGAGPLTVIRTIDVPTLSRSLGLAVGFAFAVSLGEFGATSFLVRPGAQTLPVIIASLIGRPTDGAYGAALAAAVLLGAVATTVMLVAERVRVPTSVGAWV